MLKKLGLSLAAVLALVSLPTADRALAQGMTNVTFSLDFIVLGRHAPWYVAKAKGYYKDEGLNVKIIPGKGTAQVIQAIESDIADIGFVDVPGLVLGRAAGSTIKIVAVNYQKTPYAIFSLDPGASVTQPKDLVGLTVGSSAGSFLPNIHRAFMVMHGLDPNTLKIVNIEPSARIGMLVRGKVPAIDFFIMTHPGISRAAGKRAKVKTLLMSDHGLQLYSNGIGAKEAYLKKNPETVRKFVRAALRGWKYTMDHPAEAADLQKSMVRGLKKQITIEEIAILRNLVITPDTRKHGYGWFSPALMQKSREFMVKHAKLSGPAPKAADLYMTGFLPQTPILP
jgi:NitT/TauT family transport system substrate-binding protein